MTRLIHHLRSNAIAYLALIVALGGTSYAAINLPAGSVGSRQLKNGSVTTNKLANGSVTQKKLDPKSIGGSVLHWASVDQDGGSSAAAEERKSRRTNGGCLYRITWGDAVLTILCAVLASSPGVVAHAPIADAIGHAMRPQHANGRTTSLWVFPSSAGASVAGRSTWR